MSTAKSSPLPRTEMDALLLGRLDELTINEPSSRGSGLLGIVLSIVVLIVISTFIVAAITLINPDFGSQFGAHRLQAREAISLEEVFTGALSAKMFTSTWLRAEEEGQGGADQLLYEDARDLKLVTLDAHDDSLGLENNFQPSRGKHLSKLKDAKTLISASSLLSSINYQGFRLSPSKRFLLLWTARVQQFRLSFTAKYFLYDTKLDLITMLSTQTDGVKQEAHSQRVSQQENKYESLDSASLYLNNGGVDGGVGTSHARFMGEHLEAQGEQFVRFQLANWFVDPQGHDSLLLAQNNDLFVLTNVAELGTSNGQAAPVRLTHTGKPGVIYNGLPDWLYEEEIFTTGAPANEISPSGAHLAYLSFNDTQVSELPIIWYTSDQFAVPRVQQLRYPLAGTPNPQVHLHLIENFAATTASASGGARRETTVSLPRELNERQHYLYRIKWLANERLGVIWSNREQNESRVLICKPQVATSGGDNWNCEQSLTLEAPDGWLDIGDDLHALNDQHYLALMPKFEGEQVGTFKHVARVSLERPDQFVFLTSGRREVMRIDGVDPSRSLVYYTSTLVGEPGQRHLFVASLRSPPEVDSQSRDTCITCDMSGGGGECLHSDAKLSLSMRHFILQCNGPDIPRTELRALVHNERNSLAAASAITSRLLLTFEDNVELRERLERVKAMPVTVRLRVPIPSTNYSASVMLLLPPMLGPTTSYQKSTSRTQADFGAGFSWGASFASPTSSNGNANSHRLKRDDHKRQSTRSLHVKPDGVEQIGQYVNQMSSGTGSGGGNNHQAAAAAGGGLPMIVEVYAGPSQQKVDYQAAVQVGHYFASSRRTIYAMIDGRGSGKEGSRRMFEMFGQLGKTEVEDQIGITRELVRGPLAPLVDPTKVAIWGWSYGGYAAAMALARSNMEAMRRGGALQQRSTGNLNLPQTLALPPVRGVFECAASMAPTTNLIYYDTAYSERYLRSPWKNDRYDRHKMGDHLVEEEEEPALSAKGIANKTQQTRGILFEDLNERYRRSSLLEFIGQIERKRFLLMHGTADDNVHLQGSFRLMREMIKRGIPFETRLYPDQRHSMSDLANTMHLHSTLSNFFAECFEMAY